MAKFSAKKLDPTQINGGQEYEQGDFLQSDTINDVVEGTAYAQNVAEEANTTSNKAVSTANSANSTANAASAKVDTFKQRITTAQNTADTAVSNAATAQSTADSATTEINKIKNGTTVVPNANHANDADNANMATKAQQDVNGNHINTTYATREFVTEQQGTRVKVNNANVAKLSFTSDPQTQITANKTAIAEAQSDISDIVDGSQTVGEAKRDANGNVIDETYATKSGSYENLAVGALLVNDTREVDNPPSFYYDNGQKITSEFKTGTSVGIPDAIYCSIVTIAGWLNHTGGKLTQIAYVGEKMCIRQSVDTSTWGNWASVFATDPSKLAPSTANGWTQTTATGTLPSAGVYMIAFNHLPSGSQPSYYNPAILVYDGAIGSCTVTDATGILLTSIVVTPSGIQLISPVHFGEVQSTNIYYKRIA